jgi:hypothetical protein
MQYTFAEDLSFTEEELARIEKFIKKVDLQVKVIRH